MAKYYYDRYRVNSSTSYTWTAYGIDPLYTMDFSLSNERLVSAGATLNSYSSYTLNSRTGAMTLSGNRTITAGSSSPSTYVYFGQEVTTSFITRSHYEARGSSLYRVDYRGTSSETGNQRGSYSHSTSGRSISYRLHNQVNSDGYWWMRGNASTTYTRGSFIDTVIAEDGTFPDNGRVGATYWYIKRNKAFPDFKVKANGQLRTAEEGWVKVNGILRPIEQMWVKDNNSLKEV